MTSIVQALTERRLARFLIVGAGAAGLLFALSLAFVTAGMAPFWGGALAYAIAFVVAYSLQRAWTFGGRHRHGQALPRYLTLQICCATLSGVIAHVAVDRFGLPPLAMAALATVIVSAISYVASSLWVFPERDAP